MQKYRIRDGQTLSHHGRVLVAGQEVELSDKIARSVRNKVDKADDKSHVVQRLPSGSSGNVQRGSPHKPEIVSSKARTPGVFRRAEAVDRKPGRMSYKPDKKE